MTSRDTIGLRLTLEGILKKPIVWFRDHGSRFYRCIYLGTEILLTEEDLFSLDPRLQTAVDYALPRNTALVAGGLIQATVNSWHNPDDSLWSEHNGTLFYMGKINSIVEHNAATGTVALQARTHQGKSIDGVRVLTGQEYSKNQSRDYTWMETYYPGSSKRLWSGEQLGLATTELADYVFYPPEALVINVAMPLDLAF